MFDLSHITTYSSSITKDDLNKHAAASFVSVYLFVYGFFFMVFFIVISYLFVNVSVYFSRKMDYESFVAANADPRLGKVCMI